MLAARLKAAIVLVLCLSAVRADAGCGPDPQPCSLTGGSYHVVLPKGPAPHPAVLFLHGYGGSGAGSLENLGMINTLLARGYAVIAPDGQTRAAGRGRSWDFHPDRPAKRDEAGFILSVAADAARRFGLSRDRMLLAGFSIGGSMTSYLACSQPRAFAAFAPVGGSFWRPHPSLCKGPVRLLHTHGWADMTVPLEGRRLGNSFAQGDIFQALQIWREADGCSLMRPDSFATSGIFQIRSWTTCLPEARLDFALHNGGHVIPKGWATLALDWFEALP